MYLLVRGQDATCTHDQYTESTAYDVNEITKHYSECLERPQSQDSTVNYPTIHVFSGIS